jgi:hypothetical protein
VSIIGGIITVGIASGIVAIIALVEGIIYLTKSEEFEAPTSRAQGLVLAPHGAAPS